MLWSEKDEDTLRQCRECIDNCGRYHLHPEPYFELCLRMHDALRAAGMLEAAAFSRDYCDGCVYSEGGCRRAYREAVLDERRTRVVFCRGRTTRAQREALDRAAARRRKR